ncbi:hypothetical protein Shyhy01_08870 [Streptomyces hygroscopicus subsp. hygroscopicus]|nr:hypothetical protein Shyhy01_08870 [Streptomyces hygroscopicus subsp. hygroscopicus]
MRGWFQGGGETGFGREARGPGREFSPASAPWRRSVCQVPGRGGVRADPRRGHRTLTRTWPGRTRQCDSVPATRTESGRGRSGSWQGPPTAIRLGVRLDGERVSNGSCVLADIPRLCFSRLPACRLLPDRARPPTTGWAIGSVRRFASSHAAEGRRGP